MYYLIRYLKGRKNNPHSRTIVKYAKEPKRLNHLAWFQVKKFIFLSDLV